MSESTQQRPKPVVLVILDGWGAAPDSPGNAITRAHTPNFDMFLKNYFVTTLQAAGEAVGLKWGEMGNSEVGHLNIGTGRVIYQPQPRIDKSIVDGSFYTNEVLLGACDRIKKQGGRLHIIGLASDSGVHATIEHLYALLEVAKQQNVSEVFIHPILDGRDSEYNSGAQFIARLQNKAKNIGVGIIASISGRFWAMDRDRHWDRIEHAYHAVVNADSSITFDDPLQAIKASYRNNIFDEEFQPAVSSLIPENKRGIAKNDVVIFFNFRSDRARQLTHALGDASFTEFDRKHEACDVVTFTEYDEKLGLPVAFPLPHVNSPFAKVIADAGLTQLHIAETEKYAHVTYFFNGGREEPFAGEERILIPSPPTDSYEKTPHMSAYEVTDRVVQEIDKESFDFYVVNFANPDMIGHTGNLEVTMKAIEIVDECLGNIVQVIAAHNGIMIVTADHGNAEGMVNLISGEIDKGHSARAVPCIIISAATERDEPLHTLPNLSAAASGGLLSDIAPTLLTLMRLPVPKEMTGVSLI